MQNLTNAIDAVMDKEAIQFKTAIINELSQRLYKALDGERATVANSVISGVAESSETKEEVKGVDEAHRPLKSEVGKLLSGPSKKDPSKQLGVYKLEASGKTKWVKDAANSKELIKIIQKSWSEEVDNSTTDTINEKVDLDGRTSLYRSTVARIEQARKMREQNSKAKDMKEGDEKFKGLYDDGSGKGAVIPKAIDINPKRFQHITKESVEINEDQYAEAVIMQNGKYTVKEAELSAKQKEYRKFFDAAMKKFGVKSPSDFSDDAKKKQFFDYVQKNWKG